MILTPKTNRFEEEQSDSLISKQQLVKLLVKADEFKDELLKLFPVDDKGIDVIQIGNSKHLLDAILSLDDDCEKIDNVTLVKNIKLEKLLDGEKALFSIYEVKNPYLIKHNNSDVLQAETRYSAKSDILDYYSLSKFANYCRDNVYDDLLDSIKSYLENKNSGNTDERKLRIVHVLKDDSFFIRAFTSASDYKNFGINFSAFVALMVIGDYVKKSGQQIYIDKYAVDDSNVYVSFSFSQQTKINNNLKLSFNLILENDEVKRNAVTFNGVFKLDYQENNKTSSIFIKPHGVKSSERNFPVDLLTYQHRGSVKSVFEKLQGLPDGISVFIEQVTQDAKRISAIQHPNDVKKLIADKVKFSKKPEFKAYKPQVFNKLMNMTVNNVFQLFALLRSVEDLFEHDDVVSLNYWRNKLYEALIDRN